MNSQHKQQWREANTERLRAKARIKYYANREARLEQMRQYRADPKNKTKQRERDQKRSADPAYKTQRRVKYATDIEFREQAKARARRYYQEHWAECRARMCDYLKDPEHLQALRNAQKQWRRRNPLASRMRSRIKMALRRARLKPSDKCRTIEYLGCSWAEYTTYLEGLFTPDMTWEAFNRGEIHIDHIRPLALFDLTKQEERQKALHWSNTQPLWGKDNMRKGAKNLR